VTESTVGSATGIEATVRIRTNWIVSRSGSWRNSADRTMVMTRPTVRRIRKLPIRRIARWKCETVYPQDRALEVRDGFRRFHQPGGLAEIGVHAGGRDDGRHLTLLGNRAGIGRVAGLLVDR
jgi:hypothetical protein